MIYPKKCPICGSTRISVYGYKFHCKNCGFIHDYQFPLKEKQELTL